MKHIKFFFERKYITIILVLLTIIFLVLAIKSSSEPVIGFLKGSKIEQYLFQFPNSNNFIWDLSIGFLVSVIFYIVVVYFPERQKRKDMEPFISQKCEAIIFSSYALIHEILNKSTLQVDYKTLTENQFKEVCKKVNPKLFSYHFSNSIKDTFSHHLGYKIYNDWLRIIKEIDETLRLLPFIDSGLLKRIYKINNNFLKYSAKDLSLIESLKNNSLESWSQEIYDLYVKTKDLRDYYYLYSNKDFKNDPWSNLNL